MSDRPNILVIFADQLAAKAMTEYGAPYRRTPTLDRLSAQGVRFTQCYTPCPLCQPARAAYWTGLHPHETGVLSNGRWHDVPRVPDTVDTIGALFADAGYETMHFGKQHDAGSLRGFKLEEEKELDVDVVEPWGVNYDTLRDRYTTKRAVEYLQGKPKQPFLTVVDLNNPHNICGWIGENAGPHADKPIPTELPPAPDNLEVENYAALPKSVQHVCCAHNRQAQAAGWNAENFRYYLAAYYHYLERVDAEIGLVIQALEESGAAENTLILFTADHGDSMGAHGMVTKHTHFFDETTRVPFIATGAGVSGCNIERDELVSLLDLMPTLCDFAGIESPRDRWGVSFAPQLRGDASSQTHDYVACEWHTEWGSTIEPGRMIRTERFKYAQYAEGNEEELYDLFNDPGEARNLAADPAHANALLRHRKILEDHVQATDDPFFSLEAKIDMRSNHAPGQHPVGTPAAPEALERAPR